MKDFFRQSMAWLHTWSGLLPGWLLYFVFLTGTLGYFDTEIDRWMKPELPPARYDLPAESLVALAAQRLQAEAPDATRWFIALPVDRNQPYPRLFWQGPDGTGNELMDPATGQAYAARETGGGQLLYRMHWNLHYLPRNLAEWLVGVAALGMLVALITGIIIHVKIFKDFFTFRPGKCQRSWLDAHNALSVSALPFHLMITFTGLVFMASTYMPLIAAAQYGAGPAGERRFTQELFGNLRGPAPAGQPAALVSPAALVAASEARWGAGSIGSVDVTNPGDAAARVLVNRYSGAQVLRSNEIAVFDGTSGELLEMRAAVTSTPKAVHDVLIGLHEGLFAGPILRWLYALSGLAGTAMVATGLVLWVSKQRQRAAKQPGSQRGLRLAECLNIGTLIGLPVAIAAYFWANRLLPAALPQRGEWEVHAMFLTWGALLLHAALRPAARAWLEQLACAALVFGLLPLLNALTTERGLSQSLRTGDWILAGFDLTMLALGLAFAWGTWRTARSTAPAQRRGARDRERRAVGGPLASGDRAA